MTKKVTRSQAFFAIFLGIVVVSAFLTVDVTFNTILVNEAYREIDYRISDVNITVTQGTPENAEAITINVSIKISNPTVSPDLTFRRINSVMYAQINQSQPEEIGVFEVTKVKQISPMANETISGMIYVTNDIANDLYHAALNSQLSIILDCSIYIASPLGDHVTPLMLSYNF